MGTLIEKLLNTCNYFMRFSGVPDLNGEVFSVIFLILQFLLFNNVSQEQCK